MEVELLETFGVSLREPYAKHLTGTELWELDYSRLAARPFAEIKAEILKDPGVRLEYDALDPEFEVIFSLIRLRRSQGPSTTQAYQRRGCEGP
ncbi:MAG: hypothetical protein HY897_11510 [Deltaproteobacteria bacterium]|nr:hypothetical protein [Deltaproteobacteria bacterium]